MLGAMRLLARLKGLRGTPLDIFGYGTERRTERRLIDDYRRVVEELLQSLDAARIPLAVEIASVPEHIRGFGPVKMRHLADAKAREAELLAQWRNPPDAASPRAKIPIRAAA
jgi:indolepyruvate ferredoxin oxidoreductase